MAFLVAADAKENTLAYLDAREMVSNAYRPTLATCKLRDGRKVNALTFVSKPKHRQYAPPMPIEQCVRIIRKARGQKGDNADYIRNTVKILQAAGIHDPHLEEILGNL